MKINYTKDIDIAKLFSEDDDQTEGERESSAQEIKLGE